MYTPDACRAQLLFDCTAFRANIRRLQALAAPAELLAVVKADAYGVGCDAVVPALLECGVKRLGVATWGEAEQLLKYGVELRILSGLMTEETAPAVHAGVTLPVIDLETALLINAEGERQKRKVSCQLAIDSGMGRVGIPLAAARETAAKIMQLPFLNVTGVYSHFPKAEAGDEGSLCQIAEMAALGRELQLPQTHIAASEGTLYFPAASQAPFDLVRIGLAMYGVMPEAGLQGCVTFKSRLAAVRECPAGSTISYGRLHTLTAPTRVGTVAAGYADGVPLALTNRGFFSINGKLCPILGRVTMDYTMISLEDVPEAKAGDEVILFQAGSGDVLDPRHWAELKGTHLWDILCSVSNRVRRSAVRD